MTHVARGARFRHIVFKRRGRRSPVDLAPRARFGAAAKLEARHVLLAPPELTPEEERFVTWLFEQGGLDARVYRQETLRRRLPACLRAVRADSIAEARLVLQHDAQAVDAALNVMVIGVSGFFRDAPVFEYLKDTLLPALPRTGGHPRVWSAGCSDGQEMYSLAMLLAEANLLHGSYLLGTDCRPRAIARARAGRYDARVVREVPQPLLEKYFEADDFTLVSMELRGAVQWRTDDVTSLREPGTWDLILCRNLTMYLRPDVAARLFAACEAALRPGGFLVLGKAERPLGSSRLFNVAPCVYRKDKAP